MIAPVTSTGQAHKCLPFMKRLHMCVASAVLPNQECKLFYEDFMECRSGTKQKKIDFMIEHEKRKQKLVRLPRYDPITDSFVGDFKKDGNAYFQTDHHRFGAPTQES